MWSPWNSVESALSARIHAEHQGEGKLLMTAETHSIWMVYLAPTLLNSWFINERYYMHFVQLVQLLTLCLKFEITQDQINDLERDCREALPYRTMLVVVCTYWVAGYTATLAIFGNSSLKVVTAMKKYNRLVFFCVDSLSTPAHTLTLFWISLFLTAVACWESPAKISRKRTKRFF